MTTEEMDIVIHMFGQDNRVVDESNDEATEIALHDFMYVSTEEDSSYDDYQSWQDYLEDLEG